MDIHTSPFFFRPSYIQNSLAKKHLLSTVNVNSYLLLLLHPLHKSKPSCLPTIPTPPIPAQEELNPKSQDHSP